MYRGIIYLRTSPSVKYYVGLTTNETKRQEHWLNTKRDYGGYLIRDARKRYPPETWATRFWRRSLVLRGRTLWFSLMRWRSTSFGVTTLITRSTAITSHEAARVVLVTSAARRLKRVFRPYTRVAHFQRRRRRKSLVRLRAARLRRRHAGSCRLLIRAESIQRLLGVLCL